MVIDVLAEGELSAEKMTPEQQMKAARGGTFVSRDSILLREKILT